VLDDRVDSELSGPRPIGSRFRLFCSSLWKIVTGQSWAQPRPARSLEYVSQACNPAPSEGGLPARLASPDKCGKLTD